MHEGTELQFSLISYIYLSSACSLAWLEACLLFKRQFDLDMRGIASPKADTGGQLFGQKQEVF